MLIETRDLLLDLGDGGSVPRILVLGRGGELQAAIDGWRTQLETQADALNKKYEKQVVCIVPVGDAVVKLRALIVDGKFPGITKQSQLFRDPIGHGQGHVMALAAYCNYAAIYRISPERLPLMIERSVDAEQHAILQKMAWDTVSTYSYAGIAKRKPANGE